MECDLGPVIGEFRTFDAPTVRSCSDPMEAFKRWLVAIIGVIYVAIFLIVTLGGLLIYSSTAKASSLTPVIPECIELAQREGFPTDFLTKAEAVRARVRMARLSDRDPLVKTCRAAIRAVRAANPTGAQP